MLQIGFEELENPPRTAPDEHLGDLRTAEGFRDDEPQSLGVELLEGEVGASYPWQQFFGGGDP
jgi:hypothetical protein